MFAFPVFAEFVPGCWRIAAGPWPFIAHIGPDARCRAPLFGLHFYRRFVREDGRARTNVPTDGVGQWFQKPRGLPDPTCQRGAVKIDALPLHDLALPIQRTVIRIFVHQHMRQQTRARAAALDRARGKCGLYNPVAAFAGHARAHDPVHE